MPPKRKIPGDEDGAIATPKPKRVRKVKEASVNPAPSPVEKRMGRFRSNCPKKILDRVERVFSQRFFLVDRNRNGDELREVFKVLGSTGNVYEVVIDKVSSCNCPDAIKGNHCKHLLFIYLKVLSVPTTSHMYYQRALVTEELCTIFSHAKPNPTLVAPKKILDAYGKATGSPSKASSSKAQVVQEPLVKKHKNPNGDDCAICYEEMQGDDAKLELILTWCETCDNALHMECFGQWAAAAQKKNDPVTCPHCRSKWPSPEAGAGAGGSGTGGMNATVDGGYLNLAGPGGMKRDTSSYYHRPGRGVPFYMSAYDDDSLY